MPRVTIYQGRPAGRVPESHLERLFATRPDFLCLPEYFWVPAGAAGHAEAAAFAGSAHAAVEALSRQLSCAVVGGSYVLESGGRLYNSALVYDRGRYAGEQRKRNPTDRELTRGIEPGEATEVVHAGGLRLGIAICADVLRPGAFEEMRAIGAELVLAPTLSPYLPGDTPEAKAGRDERIYAAGARAAGAPVVKACGVGRIFGSRLQGRSLVAAADGRIVARVPPEHEGRVRVIAVEL